MGTHPRHSFFLRWLVILPFIFFYQVTLGRAVFGGIDILKQHLPMKFFNVISLRNGHFPLWNPLLFQGFPHLAEGQSGPLYVGNILMYVAPIQYFVQAYDYTVILHFALGGWLTYIFFRRKGLVPLASFFASLSMNFAPFMLIHDSAPSLHQVALFFPLILMLFDASLKKPVLNSLLGSLVVCTMILAGHVQMVVYTFIALALYAIFVGIIFVPRIETGLRITRSILFILISAVIGGGLAALQILPTMELSALTERGKDLPAGFFDAGTWLTIPRLASIFTIPALDQNSDLLNYGTSIIYFGVLPILLLMFAWRDFDFRRKVIPWLWCFAIAYLLAMGLNNPLNFLLIKIPPLNMFRYLGRFSYYASFFLVYPLALALQVTLERGKGLIREGGLWKNVGREILILTGLVVLMLVFSKISPFIIMGIVFFIIQLGISMVFISRAIRKVSGDIIKLALFVHLLMFLVMGFMISNMTQIYYKNHVASLLIFNDIAHHKFRNKATFIATDRNFISASDIDNFLLTPQDHITYDASGSAGTMKWGVPIVNGYTPLKMAGRTKLHDFIVSSFNKGDPQTTDTGLLEYFLYDILGVNFLIISGKDWQFGKYNLEAGPLIYGFDKDTYLYVAKREHPGYYLRQKGSAGTIDFKVTDNPVEYLEKLYQKQKIAESMMSGEYFEARHLSLIEEKKQPVFSIMFEPTDPLMKAYEIRWDGLKEGFKFSKGMKDFDGILVHDSVYPGWVARVNGKEVDIEKGDGFFKFLPFDGEDEEVVELDYFPESFKRGLWISICFAGLWAGMVLIAVLVGRRRR